MKDVFVMKSKPVLSKKVKVVFAFVDDLITQQRPGEDLAETMTQTIPDNWTKFQCNLCAEYLKQCIENPNVQPEEGWPSDDIGFPVLSPPFETEFCFAHYEDWVCLCSVCKRERKDRIRELERNACL